MGSSPTVSFPSGRRGVALRVVLLALRASLTVTPRPTVWAIRRLFSITGGPVAVALREQAPRDVARIVVGERYGERRDAVLDVYTPLAAASEGRRLPTVVWAHGGAFVGGSKEEVGGYLQTIASAGFTVVGIDYSLAPGATYPTPVRQVMEALRHLQANADRLHVDVESFVLAGDSAGAHITAQAAATVTTPGYGQRFGVEPTIAERQLRGVVLCCGVFDLTLVDPDSPVKDFIRAVAWAYAGTRHYATDERFTSTVTVTDHLTAAFPPTFVTAGNADPLVGHSQALAAALEAQSVDLDALFYPDEHDPALPHEYQFDLSLDDARIALHRLLDYLREHTDSA